MLIIFIFAYFDVNVDACREMLMATVEMTAEKPYYEPTLSMAKRNDSCAGLALDMGCGKNPYFFRNHFNSYIGIDIDINTLKRVSHDLPDASLIYASGSYAPFINGIFNLVICTEVLEHLENPEKMISEISRVLTKGGKAVVSIPSLSLPQAILLWIGYRVRKISEKPYQSPDHVREYSRFKVTPHFEKTIELFKLFRQKKLEIRDFVTVQSLYTNPKILYNGFLSKTEKLFEKFLSKNLFGHHTIFEAEKEQEFSLE
jgi:SAM-dependent methyltransferase